ncbi:MAG: DUF4143 domain-containing protein [Lachnospiraceae bacterium]
MWLKELTSPFSPDVEKAYQECMAACEKSIENFAFESILKKELSELYRGSLAENYTAQTLRAKGYELYYWTNDSPAAELDFVIQKQGKIIPIEVKSGENVRSKSLQHFTKMYAPDEIVRLSEKNYGTDGQIRAVPLYAAFCI